MKILIYIFIYFLTFNIVVAIPKDTSVVTKEEFNRYCEKLIKENQDSLSSIKNELNKNFKIETDQLFDRNIMIIGIFIAIMAIIIGGLITYTFFRIKSLKNQTENLNVEFEKKADIQIKEFEDKLQEANDKLISLTKLIDPVKGEAEEYINILNKRKIDISKIEEESEDTRDKLRELSKNIEERQKKGKELTAEDYFYKSTEYFTINDFDNAFKYISKAIDIKPDFTNAWFNKSILLQRLAKYEDALKCYDKVIELKPDFATAWYNRACIYSHLKIKDEMLICLKKAIELDEKNIEAAKKDEDFKEYWNDKDFKRIVEILFIPKFDHFYTTSFDEKDQAITKYKYKFEGIQCYIFVTKKVNTVPFYRFYNSVSGDHFYTISEKESGIVTKNNYIFEGITGYVYSDMFIDTIPLFRLVNIINHDNFYTTSDEERLKAINNYNYKDFGISCYVSSGQGVDKVPLYRLFKDYK